MSWSPTLTWRALGSAVALAFLAFGLASADTVVATIDGFEIRETGNVAFNSAQPNFEAKAYTITSAPIAGPFLSGPAEEAQERAYCTRMAAAINQFRRQNNYTLPLPFYRSVTLPNGDYFYLPRAGCSTTPMNMTTRTYRYQVQLQMGRDGSNSRATTAPAPAASAPRPPPATTSQASQSVCLPPEQLVGTWAIMDMPGYVVRIVPGQFGLDVGVRSPDYTRPGSFMWLGGPGMLRPTRSDPCFFTRNGAMSQDGMRYDPRTRTISFRPGTRGQPGGLTINKERDDTGLPYTRTDSPPPMPVRCGERDIEGQWRRRSDGMTMEVMTMNFQGGGSARVLTHPARTWPSDVPKLDNIVQTAPEACTYGARCYTLKYNSEGYFGEQEACILNYDPDRRLLTASGTHGTFELITGR
ncbi:MAG: hypothetical protein U1E50_00010 [Caulobacteraceae bacterium]